MLSGFTRESQKRPSNLESLSEIISSVSSCRDHISCRKVRVRSWLGIWVSSEMKCAIFVNLSTNIQMRLHPWILLWCSLRWSFMVDISYPKAIWDRNCYAGTPCLVDMCYISWHIPCPVRPSWASRRVPAIIPWTCIVPSDLRSLNYTTTRRSFGAMHDRLNISFGLVAD